MAKRKLEIWLRIYQNGLVVAYENEKAAKLHSGRRKLFAVKSVTIEVEEGEGL